MLETLTPQEQGRCRPGSRPGTQVRYTPLPSPSPAARRSTGPRPGSCIHSGLGAGDVSQSEKLALLLALVVVPRRAGGGNARAVEVSRSDTERLRSGNRYRDVEQGQSTWIYAVLLCSERTGFCKACTSPGCAGLGAWLQGCRFIVSDKAEP